LREEEIEQALSRLERAQDDLEEILSAASERDGMDYFSFCRMRVRVLDGRFYILLIWSGQEPPPASVVYAPLGFWIARWYKAVGADGEVIWESVLEENT
jgi:hypothetical protein